MEDTTVEESFLRKLMRLASHPVTSFVIGIVGIALAVYFYCAGIRRPKLYIATYPIRTPIVQTGRLSDLAVTFHGKPVAGDLTAVQIMIWNSGNAPVRHDDILQPVSVSTPGNHPIYEATVRRVSRDVTGFQIMTNALASGRLGFDWRILEHNDGASVQVIYGGDQNLKFSNTGVVVDQKFIPFYTANIDKTGFWQQAWQVVAPILLALLFIRVAVVLFPEFKKAKREQKTWRMVVSGSFFTVSVFLAIFFTLGIALAFVEPVKPPFDF